jgi:hypothetical protein
MPFTVPLYGRVIKKDAFLIPEKRPSAEDRIHLMNLFNWDPDFRV